MRRLIWSESARHDLELIESYLLREKPEYYADLLSLTRQSARFLLETPGAGSPIEASGLRKWRIDRTPYLMVYHFTRHELRILRVHHESQDWRPRR